MGNQNSRPNPQSPTGSSVTSSHGGAQQHQRQHQHQPQPQHEQRRPLSNAHPHPTARRRESIQALSIVKAQAAPPSASLENAESHPSSARQRSRGRSQSVANSSTTSAGTAQVAIQLRAAHDSFRPASATTSTMGNEQSRQSERDRDRERDKIQLAREFTPLPLLPTASRPLQAPQAKPSPAPSAPVPVPAPPREIETPSDFIVPSSHFSRPPRLPLPIEEELHTPGSPIITPQDLSSPLDHGEVEGVLPRRSSMLSTTTADDDDLGDEFKGPNTGRPTVPTLIEWEGPGERVYVTGTFAGWNKKYKLHPNGPSKKPDALSAHVPIAPGTHHLMFIVDDDMCTSDKLPTAVDYTNILVNYLEVSYDQVPTPAPIPGKEPNDATTQASARQVPAGVFPPQVLPPTPELLPIKAPLPEPAKPKEPDPEKKYHQTIPRFLLDLDAPEESSRFARANAMTNHLPTPPTLPGFLGKSILNGTTPMKDDSSVLIHPNHTVLNHLATSSIKDNILATSATTRYKQKFLTTIMYKPKEEHPEHVY